MNGNVARIIKEPNHRGFFDLLGVGHESNCRFAWVRRGIGSNSNKWFPLGQKISHGVSSCTPLSTPSDVFSEVATSSIETFKNTDFFMSPNQFFGWRCKRSLAKLHANYIEIDTLEHQILSVAEENQIIDDVLAKLEASSLPLPNAIVKSGSGGLHLYWIYSPVEAFRWRLNVWQQFTEKVKSELGSGLNWHVDTQASLDPTRVLRLPGSCHSKSKRAVLAYVIQQERYEFNSLLQSVGINTERPTYLKPVEKETDRVSKPTVQAKKPLSISQLEKQKSNSKHNINGWWLRTYWAVLNHFKNRQVSEGKRDSVAFILYVALRHIKKDPDLAFEEIRRINDSKIGLSSDELESFLSTARKKKYRYRKETLANYLVNNLDMNVDYLYDSIKVRLTPLEVSIRRQHGALLTAASKKQRTLDSLIQKRSQLLAMGYQVTQANLAEAINISERTVRRYWRILLDKQEVISSASI